MPEALVLLAGLLVAGLLVVPPLWRVGSDAPASEDTEAAALRYRVALERLRDLETDRRAGSLDEGAYRRERALAEAEAMRARTERDAARAGPLPTQRPPDDGNPLARSIALGVAAALGALVLFGSLVPPPFGLAAGTVVDAELAAAQAAEAQRQDRIETLLERLEGGPLDLETLSELADTYLAGEGIDDLAAAARVLQVIISLDPDNLEAYRGIIGAYLAAGDAANAAAALDAYAKVETDAAEVAFYRGLVALRAGDTAVAVDAFDSFLRLKPDDERAAMVRGLRAEALEAAN